MTKQVVAQVPFLRKYTDKEKDNLANYAAKLFTLNVFYDVNKRIISFSSFSDGKITVPIKVEQHFSAGEQQIFVMSLYQSLAEIRTSELPFVIDTPLARIDSEHRRNILDHFFSRLPGQVIILSTDEEINNEGMAVLSSKISQISISADRDVPAFSKAGAFFLLRYLKNGGKMSVV